MTGRGVHVVDAMLYLAGPIGIGLRAELPPARTTTASTTPPRCCSASAAARPATSARSSPPPRPGACRSSARRAGSRSATSSTCTTWDLQACFIDPADPMTKQPPEVRHLPEDEHRARRARAFRARRRARAGRSPLPGGDEVHNVAVLEAIVRSARDGQRITDRMKTSSCPCARASAPWRMAQAWPTKPIRVVVPSPPGGPPDLIIRMLAPKMNLGQPLVIENRARRRRHRRHRLRREDSRPTATRGSSPPRRTSTRRRSTTTCRSIR